MKITEIPPPPPPIQHAVREEQKDIDPESDNEREDARTVSPFDFSQQSLDCPIVMHTEICIPFVAMLIGEDRLRSILFGANRGIKFDETMGDTVMKFCNENTRFRFNALNNRTTIVHQPQREKPPKITPRPEDDKGAQQWDANRWTQLIQAGERAVKYGAATFMARFYPAKMVRNQQFSCKFYWGGYLSRETDTNGNKVSKYCDEEMQSMQNEVEELITNMASQIVVAMKTDEESAQQIVQLSRSYQEQMADLMAQKEDMDPNDYKAACMDIMERQHFDLDALDGDQQEEAQSSNDQQMNDEQ